MAAFADLVHCRDTMKYRPAVRPGIGTFAPSGCRPPSSALRVQLLGLTLGLVLAGIGGRVAQVQLSAPSHLDRLDRVRERFEVLPTRRGRILAADNTVLAEDVAVLTLSIHYRYLEQPLNAGWLARQARQSLDARERKDRTLIEREIRRQRARIAQLWSDLAGLLQCDVQRLRRCAADIQHRVEAIRKSVAQRHRATSSAEPTVEHTTEGPWWAAAWNQVLDALTAEGEPPQLEHLVLQEEEDYHPIFTFPIDLQHRDLSGIIAEIEGHPDRYPGVRLNWRHHRIYPRGPLAAHLVGYVARVTAEDVRQSADATAHESASALALEQARVSEDFAGKSGVEESYETVLRGKRGEVRQVVDRLGRTLVRMDRVEPQPGSDVVLWLEPALQQRAQELLAAAIDNTPATSGAAIVLDVRSGGVLAAASAPTFNPNGLIEPDEKTWKSIQEDQGRPLFNRATRMAIAPGSVFKAATAIAALESGRIDAYHTETCHGYLNPQYRNRFRCLIYVKYQVGHGPTNLVDAITRSCNVYFGRCAEAVGPTVLCRWYEALGFGQRTGIDVPYESPGYLPTPWNVRGRFGHAWRRGDTPRLAIGQSYLQATPLQIARLMAAIANGGRLVTPRVVRNIARPSAPPSAAGVQWAGHEELVAREDLLLKVSSHTLEQLHVGLRQVVANPRGTAYRSVRMQEVDISGKTGTAETHGRDDHAWFAGFVPSDKPKYAVVVALEHGGSGGRNAGPVAKQLVEAMLKQGLLDG